MKEIYLANDTSFGCPVEATTSLIGKKWVPSILMILNQKPHRFGELQTALSGCSKKVLKQQLNLLITNGLISNSKVTIANMVESTYQLTTTGESLMPIVLAMKTWGKQHLICQRKLA
ncbi:winged helix-turn-helix transcriptional regulator [Paucilactobacillus wasatchensis]|uniref:Putative transcriptional regulator n=1 Tax=Paucilactobacillus wasatchensis TaxID=1335616 RepID=A0A0D1A7R9_9LACO|nr:helix-turn-helix domain-containing protein [Paucilactobacillus wasatchensis]KIS03890.1 putative transcriptional regulator [Paucilactobacillus wasatchensis]